MTCYLAFGCSSYTDPRVREEGPYEWPDDELHNGIAHVYLEDHGDDPGEILIKVYGTSEDAVILAWHKAKNRIPIGGFIK